MWMEDEKLAHEKMFNIIREMQIKTTRYHFSFKTDNNKCWLEGGKAGTHIYYWWEYKMNGIVTLKKQFGSIKLHTRTNYLTQLSHC